MVTFADAGPPAGAAPLRASRCGGAAETDEARRDRARAVQVYILSVLKVQDWSRRDGSSVCFRERKAGLLLTMSWKTREMTYSYTSAMLQSQLGYTFVLFEDLISALLQVDFLQEISTMLFQIRDTKRCLWLRRSIWPVYPM